ncbi:MAG: hypothetical protein ACXV3D_09275, partial [Halobacteriota archaeon]
MQAWRRLEPSPSSSVKREEARHFAPGSGTWKGFGRGDDSDCAWGARSPSHLSKHNYARASITLAAIVLISGGVNWDGAPPAQCPLERGA